MAFSYSFWPVAPQLAPLIDQIYVFRCNEDRFEAPAGALLPQLMWQLSGQLGWIAGDKREQPCFPATLLGPSRGALRLTSEGVTTIVGVGLFPEGWHALIEPDADTLVGQLIDLTTLWGDDALEPLAGTPDEPDRALAARLEGHLLTRLQHAPPQDARVAAISRWINGPTGDIDQLTTELAVSRRQLERIARRAHGLPPRLLANKHRTLKLAAMLAAGIDLKTAWLDDFADQSHFTREFRRFMGVTPTAFLRSEGVLVREIMRVRREIASHHPLGLG
ncbi:hypothetical protein SPAN111604_07360 [Sphingomonas antarctica]|uniref:AraC family transcriptional regulator n=1 Tax=Sphingomonas antarctica TaxID=2040274 RepID=UPI0039EC166A